MRFTLVSRSQNHSGKIIALLFIDTIGVVSIDSVGLIIFSDLCLNIMYAFDVKSACLNADMISNSRFFIRLKTGIVEVYELCQEGIKHVASIPGGGETFLRPIYSRESIITLSTSASQLVATSTLDFKKKKLLPKSGDSSIHCIHKTDTDRIIVGRDDGVVDIYMDGQHACSIAAAKGPIFCISTKGTYVYLSGPENFIFAIDISLEKPRLCPSFQINTFGVFEMKCTENHLILNCWDGKIRFLALPYLSEIGHLELKTPAECIYAHPLKKSLVVGSRDGSIQTFNYEL
jgi:hypothetical protein